MSRIIIRNIYITDLQAAPRVEWFTEKNRKWAQIASDAMRDNGVTITDEFAAPINDVQLQDFLNQHATVHPLAKLQLGRSK